MDTGPRIWMTREQSLENTARPGVQTHGSHWQLFSSRPPNPRLPRAEPSPSPRKPQGESGAPNGLPRRPIDNLPPLPRHEIPHARLLRVIRIVCPGRTSRTSEKALLICDRVRQKAARVDTTMTIINASPQMVLHPHPCLCVAIAAHSKNPIPLVPISVAREISRRYCATNIRRRGVVQVRKSQFPPPPPRFILSVHALSSPRCPRLRRTLCGRQSRCASAVRLPFHKRRRLLRWPWATGMRRRRMTRRCRTTLR